MSKKGYSTPGNGKKQDSKKKASATPMGNEGDDVMVPRQEMRVPLAFQSKSSGSMDLSPYKCLCPTSVLRNLQLVPGNLLVIERSAGVIGDASINDILICRAWPNKKSIQSQAVTDKLVLNKIWLSNFENGVETKKFVVKPMQDKQ
jgi:hypothetical protein